MEDMILFNGRSSTDFEMIVTEYPVLSRGVRRGDSYQIAGRNGTQIREDNTFENYIMTYKVGFPEGQIGPSATTAEIAKWLLGSRGYCRLEDSFEPDFYRLARYAGPLNISQLLDKYGTAPLTFDCQPERYLKTGEKAVTALESVPPLMAASFELSNPTGQIARPLIRITGQGELQFAVDAVGYERVAVRVLLETKNTVIIDSDTYKVTYPDGAEANNAVDLKNGLSYPIWPVLGPGVNTISNIQRNTGGVIEKLEIIPRWWSL